MPLRRIAQALGGARDVQVSAHIGATACGAPLPAKDTTEELHGQDEAGGPWTNPSSVIGGQTARRHDAMHVGMADQRLAPGVEDAEDADLRAQVTRVGGHLASRRRTRLQQPGVQARGVAIAQWQERMRQREDDRDVRHVEELTFPGGEPSGARLRLTRRTVAIATTFAVRPVVAWTVWSRRDSAISPLPSARKSHFSGHRGHPRLRVADVAPNRYGRVLASHELVAQPL